jgi:hypothetical protein
MKFATTHHVLVQRAGSAILSSLVFAGCSLGLSAPTNPIAQTALPGTPYVVKLYGPDYKLDYWYSISDGTSVLINRFLGSARVPGMDMENDQLIDEGSGVFKIRWGSRDPEEFTVIDAKNRKVVADANMANPANEPF